MKKLMKSSFFLFIAAALVLSSCQVEMSKRLYSGGYYIDCHWKQSSNATVKAKRTALAKSSMQAIPASEKLAACNSNADPALAKQLIVQMQTEKIKHHAIGKGEISTPTRFTKNTEVSMPKSTEQVKAAKHVLLTHKAMAGDDWTIALILAIVSVVILPLSLHRFYLGYIGIAIAQILLTLIIIGWIWQVIDLIRIIIKDLGPNGGSYR